MSDEIFLRSRIKELEEEIQERENDLKHFRSELSCVNEKLESLIADLHKQLQVISQVHKNLVPVDIAHIPGFEFSYKFLPSMHQGGDYFDIFEYERTTRFCCLVASCLGSQLSALLLASLLRLTPSRKGQKKYLPHEVIQKVLQELQSQNANIKGVSLFYALIDRRNFQMSYCKLGQGVFLHHKKETSELCLLEQESNETFLGKPKSREVVLNPRDRLVFCTPGIVEAKNPEGEEFGQERLFQVILGSCNQDVHEARQEILFQIQEFTQSQDRQRDQTVVICEVKDRVVRLKTAK